MALRLEDNRCPGCGRRYCVGATGRPVCPRCRALLPERLPRGTLQRLFRIRRRWAADGKTLIFERYEG